MQNRVAVVFTIMGEWKQTQEYGNEIHCHVYTLAKFQENTIKLSYIHVQYTIDALFRAFTCVCVFVCVREGGRDGGKGGIN